DATVRQAAAHAAGLNRDPLALEGLEHLLKDSSPAVARAAAEALGRLGDRLACGPLLAAAARPAGGDHAPEDRALEHSLIYALIEIGAPDECLRTLVGDDPGSCGAALVALDQMATRVPGVELDSTRALALCSSSDAKLRDTAWWVAARHPEWSAALAGQVRPQLELSAQSPPETAARARATLAKLAGNSAVAAALGEVLADPEAPGKIVAAALLVCQATAVKATPDAWIEAFAQRLDGSVGQAADLPSQQTAIVETLGALSLSAEQRQRLRDGLLALAEDRAVPARTVLAGLQLLGSARGDLPAGVTSRIISQLSGESPPLDRAAAARLLAAGPLADTALETIAGVCGELGANELSLLLPALTQAGGDVLVEALQQIAHSEQVPRLRRDLLEAAVAALPVESAPAGKALLEQATSAAAGQQSIQELARALPPGDAARGHAVFAGSKGACTTCHAMAYVGGRFGPDLSRIGGIRTPHDLLEAIVRPSAAFVRSYEPVVVITEDGLAYQGILREENASEVVLQTGAAAIERIARSDVAAIEPGTVSLMPQGYDTVLSPEELADLVAFLARAK
ncbi:MAG: HEAT repeat domain-containing protein, partial [Planctomycetota bacterium]